MAGFGFKSVAHWFASAWHGVLTGVNMAEKAIPVIQNDLAAVEKELENPLIGGIVQAVPGGALGMTIVRAGLSALGHLTGGLHALDNAVVAKGVDIHLDGEVALEFKAFIDSFRPHLAVAGAPIAVAPKPPAQP